MKTLTYEDKIKLIKKYYKKNPTFLELTISNYEEHNLYISINDMGKGKDYKLSWFDLDMIVSKNIDRYVSCQYIPTIIIESIKESFLTYHADTNVKEETIKDDYIVTLKANLKTKHLDNIDVKFRRYLSGKSAYLMDLFIFIFDHMPRIYEEFLFEILSKLTHSSERYEYKKEFEFDLFEDDIDELFEYIISVRGKKYYEEGRVQFLEKIDDRYFAVVEGSEKYLTVINYNEEEQKMKVYCSCPCEFYCKHIYAVIMAIRNNEFKRFYKVMYNNTNKDLYERIVDFDYYLCTGVVEQNLELINNYGEIELVPILDINNECNWKVLEDSEDEELTKQIKYFLDNKEEK